MVLEVAADPDAHQWESETPRAARLWFQLRGDDGVQDSLCTVHHVSTAYDSGAHDFQSTRSGLGKCAGRHLHDARAVSLIKSD